MDYASDIFEEFENGFRNGKGIAISHAFCPECGKLIVLFQHGVACYSGMCDEEISSICKMDSEMVIYPRFPAGYPLDKNIPEKYASLFRESEQVNNISPRASATLSRYLLQLLLHEELSIQERTLEQEISKLEKVTNMPSNLIMMFQIFRRIANFGAHPKKSTNSSEIVEVENGESEIMLELLVELFDYVFVKPKKQNDFLKRVEEKYGIVQERE